MIELRWCCALVPAWPGAASTCGPGPRRWAPLGAWAGWGAACCCSCVALGRPGTGRRATPLWAHGQPHRCLLHPRCGAALRRRVAAPDRASTTSRMPLPWLCCILPCFHSISLSGYRKQRPKTCNRTMAWCPGKAAAGDRPPASSCLRLCLRGRWLGPRDTSERRRTSSWVKTLPNFSLRAGDDGAACTIHLPKGVAKGSVHRTGRWGQFWGKSPSCALFNVVGVCVLPSLRLHCWPPSAEAAPCLCCACLCFNFLLALVCPPRVLGLPQSSPSSQ
jgi:hypothetical protein